MTTPTEPTQQPKKKFDPDEFRMTIGEHLEELRKRLVYGLLGFAIVLIFFMVPAIGKRAMMVLCKPLSDGLRAHHLPPEIYLNGLTEGFMTYLQISIVAAIVFAGPWLIYQMWLFISAGLYPHERKAVTRYMPLSVSLFASGGVVVYFVVLPLTVRFFLDFNADMPLPGSVVSENVVKGGKAFRSRPLMETPKYSPIPRCGTIYAKNGSSFVCPA